MTGRWGWIEILLLSVAAFLALCCLQPCGASKAALNNLPAPLKELPSFPKLCKDFELVATLASIDNGVIREKPKSFLEMVGGYLLTILDFPESLVQVAFEFWDWVGSQNQFPDKDTVEAVGRCLFEALPAILSGLVDSLELVLQRFRQISTLSQSPPQVAKALRTNADICEFVASRINDARLALKAQIEVFTCLGDFKSEHMPFIMLKMHSLKAFLNLTKITALLQSRQLMATPSGLEMSPTKVNELMTKAIRTYEEYQATLSRCATALDAKVDEYGLIVEPGFPEVYTVQSLVRLRQHYQAARQSIKNTDSKWHSDELGHQFNALVGGHLESYSRYVTQVWRQFPEQDLQMTIAVNSDTLTVETCEEKLRIFCENPESASPEELGSFLATALSNYFSNQHYDLFKTVFDAFIKKAGGSSDPEMTALVKNIRLVYSAGLLKTMIPNAQYQTLESMYKFSGLSEHIKALISKQEPLDQREERVLSVDLLKLTQTLRRYALLLIAEVTPLIEYYPLQWDDLYALMETIKPMAEKYAVQYGEASQGYTEGYVQLLEKSSTMPAFLNVASQVLRRFSPEHQYIEIIDIVYPYF